MSRHSSSRSRYELVMGRREDHFLRYFALMLLFVGVLLAPKLYKQYQANPKLKAEAIAIFKNLTFRVVVSQ